jgi:hypothetical protein
MEATSVMICAPKKGLKKMHPFKGEKKKNREAGGVRRIQTPH